MTVKATQKVIKIGSSSGITLPAKEIERANIRPGDTIEVIVRKVDPLKRDEFTDKAQELLKRYKKDFDNLASR